MAIREGAWDCPSCGRKGNRGPEKYCGGCGAPRGSDVPFYLPEDSAEIRDAKALARATAGPDWTCTFCSGDNPGEATFCTGCGAGRDDGKSRVVEVRPVPSGVGGPPVEPPTSPLTAVATGVKPARRGCLKPLLGAALAVLAALWFFNRGRPTTLTVAEVSWERAIQIEQLRTLIEQPWEGEVPAGARVLSQETALHHMQPVQTGTTTRTREVSRQVQSGTEQVKTGVRDLGNGYFEDVYESRPVYETRYETETYEEPVYTQVPVMRTRYRVEVDRWVEAREVRLRGGSDPPSWPETSLVDKEREGKRSESYLVRFRDEKRRDRMYEPTSEDEFLRFPVGSRHAGSVSRLGKILKINELER